MLKKMLMLILILAVSSVYAGQVDLKISSKNGSPVTPAKVITTIPSDTVGLDLYWTSANGQNLFAISVDMEVTGPGSITNMYTGPMASNPDLTFPADTWDTGFTKITEVTAGKKYTIELVALMYGLGYATPPGAPIGEPGLIAMDHMLFHCDVAGDVSIGMVFNYDTATADSIDYPNMDQPTLGGPVTIHQIPEPATMTLLCLGGLLLKRRK